MYTNFVASYVYLKMGRTMFNETIPYITLDEKFSVVYTHDKIKEEYSGLLTADFFRNLLADYEDEDFSVPVELDAGLAGARDVKLVFYKDSDGLKCMPVKSRVYDNNRQRNINYRLREPISSIFAMLPILTDNINKLDSDNAVSNLESINMQSYKLLKNVTNMSLVSRIMTGDMPGKNTLNMSSLVESLVFAVKTVERRVKINYTVEEDVCLYANKGLIVNALLNLISNSINFKTDENVVINISLKKDGENVVFSYGDNSKGIKDENLAYIFKPYYSQDPYADGESEPALGLGLFIMKNAFESAGGKIMTSSVFGKGVKYIVTLPAAQDTSNPLECNSAEFLLNRYSELFVQLCDSCQLPSLA